LLNNKIKEGRMHVFDTEAGATLFQKNVNINMELILLEF
jgi:hypothetical protein